MRFFFSTIIACLFGLVYVGKGQTTKRKNTTMENWQTTTKIVF